MRWLRRIFLILLALPLLLIGLALIWLQTDFAHRQLATWIAEATAGGNAQVRIGRIEGTLPTDITLHDFEIADAQGSWFQGDRLHLTWSPMALLSRQVKIDIIEADTLTVMRAPAPSAPQPASNEPFSLPHLPVTIDLGKLTIARLSLPKALAGDDMALGIQAQASAHRSGDLILQLSAHRLDQGNGSDDISLNAAYGRRADQLSIDATIDEPRGGIVGKLAGLPDGRHLAIRAKGDAPLSKWSGTLSARLDDIALLDMKATISGSNSDRQFDLSLTGDPSPLVPANIQPILAGGVKLAGNGHLRQTADAMQIDINAMQLQGEAFDLTATGSIDPAGESQLQLQISRLSDKVAAPFVPQLGWTRLAATGEITGRLALPQVKISTEIADLAYGGNKVGRLTSTLAAAPGKATTEPIDVTIDVTADGIEPAQANLRSLAAGELQMDIKGSLDRQGTIELPTIALAGSGITLDGQLQARDWGKTAHAALALGAADLAPFRAIAGLPVKGGLKIIADATRTADGAALKLDAAAEDFASGQTQLDNLLGPAPHLVLDVSQSGNTNLEIRQAELTGHAMHLEAQGQANSQDVALNLTGDIPDLAAIDRQFAGNLGLKIKVSGSPQQPRLDGDFAATRLAAGRISAKNIALSAEIRDLKALSGIAATGKADLNGLPLTFKTAANVASKDGSTTIRIEDLQLQLARASLSAQAQSTNGLTAGQARLTIPDLAELRPLTLADAKGRLELATTLSIANGQQNIETTATGSNLAYTDMATVSRLQLAAKLLDALRTPSVSASLDLTDIAASHQKLTTARATLNGSLANLAFALSGKGPQLDLDLAGSAATAKAGDRLTLERAKFTYQGQQIALLHPAQLLRQGQSIDIGQLSFANGKGQLALQGKLTPDGNRLDLDIRHLSFGLLALVAPAYRINGEANGSLRLAGSKSAPEADLQLSLDGISSSDLSIPPTAAKIGATWRGGRLESHSEVKIASQAQPLLLAASLPLPADPSNGLPRFDPEADITASVTGKIDLAIVNGLFLDGVSHVGGQADLDLKAAGPLSKPALSGKINLADGSYNNLRTGTRLRAIEAAILANGTHIELQHLAAKTPGNGTLSGTGQVDLGDKRDVSVHILANNAQLLDSNLASAVADADLSITTPDATSMLVAGRIKVDKAEIRIPDNLPASVQEIPVTERNSEAKTTTPTSSPASPPASAGTAPQTRIALDIKVDAPQQIAVRGRGLDAELGGKLHIGGHAGQPAITGQLNLRHGTMDLVGRNLAFDHGVITFDGGTPIDPLLDFSAKSKADAYDITVTVGGTATKPSLAITSTPELPQDEALARLLFGRSAGALSPLQALQLAQATAQLAGVNTGPDVFDKLRRATGLDRLSFDAGQDAGSKTAATGPSLNAGRYVAPGVYLGVKQGAKAGSSAATVEIDVTPHVKLETDIGAADSSKAGINMQWDY